MIIDRKSVTINAKITKSSKAINIAVGTYTNAPVLMDEKGVSRIDLDYVNSEGFWYDEDKNITIIEIKDVVIKSIEKALLDKGIKVGNVKRKINVWA